jgi:hypothetical protein
MKSVLMWVCSVCGSADEDQDAVLRHERFCLAEKEQEDKETKRRVESGQLTIRQIIERCEALKPYETLPVRVFDEDGEHYHGQHVYSTDSYRGYYNELSIDPLSDAEAVRLRHSGMTLAQFTTAMYGAVGRTYSGWKGGEYTMHDDTFVWIAERGTSDGLMVKDLKLSDNGADIRLVGKRDRD